MLIWLYIMSCFSLRVINSLTIITVIHDQTCLSDPILETVSTMCELYRWRTRSWKAPEILKQNKIDKTFLPSTICHAIPNIMLSFILGFDSKDPISTGKRSTSHFSPPNVTHQFADHTVQPLFLGTHRWNGWVRVSITCSHKAFKCRWSN